jgi:hypothetical protein
MIEYPKWVYPAGIKEVYEPGEEPFLVECAEDVPEAEPETKRRGRPPEVVEAE